MTLISPTSVSTQKPHVDLKKQNPIGVFDSGLGGLAIARTLQQAMPNESLVYFADKGYSPYGPKPKDTIVARSDYVTGFLIEQGCKAVVVACNTATVNSIAQLRAKYAVPIVGVEPAVKPAALQSKQGLIGILATEQTLNSAAFENLIRSYARAVRVMVRACPEFVSIVENLQHESNKATCEVKKYVQPLLDAGCDQIVLGCTHFTFLKPAIERLVGSKAVVIDTVDAVGRQVQRKLNEYNILNDAGIGGDFTFWTSGNIDEASVSIGTLWQHNVKVLKSQ